MAEKTKDKFYVKPEKVVESLEGYDFERVVVVGYLKGSNKMFAAASHSSIQAVMDAEQFIKNVKNPDFEDWEDE